MVFNLDYIIIQVLIAQRILQRHLQEQIKKLMKPGNRLCVLRVLIMIILQVSARRVRQDTIVPGMVVG